MQTYHAHATISGNSLLVLGKLPFPEGEEVVVTIEQANPQHAKREFPYRGMPYKYEDPFSPAFDENEWDALKNDLA